MSDHYQGPAILVAEGREIPVTAKLWTYIEDERTHVEDSPLYGWRGILEGEDAFQGRFALSTAVRLPDGREGTVYGMSGDGASPNRIEIRGSGAPPWYSA